MIIFQHASDLQKYLGGIRNRRLKTGFVPTMGALHDGHLSLIRQCKKQNDITLASIFVNPVQFNNPDDFSKYPITIERDISLLEGSGTDILFLPSAEEIYPDKKDMEKHYNLGDLGTILEGKFRPGHFQGVCMVMDRLLHIVNPNRLYLGQKDFQQVMVIRKLISLLNLSSEVITAPIIREKNGLAMSSRNQRLTEPEKERASTIYKQLKWISENRFTVGFPDLKNKAIDQLEKAGLKVEYLVLADASNLSLTNEFNEHIKMILLTAVYAGEVRLIDNLIL